MRQVLVNMYKDGGVKNFGELMNRVLIEASKQSAVGAVTGTAGVAGKIGKIFLGKQAANIASPILQKTVQAVAKATPTAGEITALTGASAAVEGRVPTVKDFEDNAAMLLTLKGAKFAGQKAFNRSKANIQAKLEKTYVDEGKAPAETVAEANSDPVKLQDIVSENGTSEAPEEVKAIAKNDTAQNVDRSKAAIAATEIPYDKKTSALPEGELDVDTVVKKSGIIQDLKDAVKLSINYGKVKGKNVAGFYNQKQEYARIKNANDLPTVSHEIAHHIAKLWFGDSQSESLVPYLDEFKKIATKPAGKVTDKAMAGEGFAEFVSGFVVNPEGMKKVAPKFYDKFAKEAPEKDPSTFKALTAAQEKVKQYVAQSAAERIASGISFKPEDKSQPVSVKKAVSAASEKMSDFVDDQRALKVITDKIEQSSGKKIPTDQNPYRLARLFKGWSWRAKHFLLRATYDFKTLKNNGESFADIVRNVEDKKELSVYLVAARDIELNRRGIVSGDDIRDARKVYRELKPKYGDVAKRLYTYQNRLLKLLEDSELKDSETVKTIRKLNKYHVPFYRVLETPEEYGLGSSKMAAKDVLKKIKGSTREKIDPLESIVKDTFNIINAVERARVGSSLANLAGLDKSGQFIREVPRKSVSVAKVDGESIFRLSDTINKNNEIAVYKKGKLHIYEVDPAIAQIVNGLNPQAANDIINFMGLFKRALTAGATGLNASWAIKNAIRDSTFAYLSSTTGFNPLRNKEGWKAALEKDKIYWEYMKAGAGGSTFVDMSRDNMREVLNKLGDGYPKRVWNSITDKQLMKAIDVGLFEPTINTLGFVGETSELGTRLGEFISSMRGKEWTKKNLEDAAFNAREITLDFAKGSATSRFINMLAAFFNANALGISKTFEIMKDPDRGLKALSFLGALGTAEALANFNWKKGDEDDDIKEVIQAQKDTNYVFKVGGVIYRVPKPQNIGYLSTLSYELTMKMLASMKGEDRDEMATHLAKALWNEFELNPIPTVATVPMELYFNKSIFFDRPIVPASMENVLPEYQYLPHTTETAKSLSKLLGGFVGKENTFSPIKAEYVITGWGAGVGSAALHITDYALRKAGLVPDPVKPADTLADIPFVKSFVVRHPSSSAESLNEFYNKYNEKMRYINSFNLESKRGDIEGIRDLISSQAWGMLSGINKQLSESAAVVRNIENNPQMTADEKRQLIDNLYNMRIQTARYGLTLIKKIDNNIKEFNK